MHLFQNLKNWAEKTLVKRKQKPQEPPIAPPSKHQPSVVDKKKDVDEKGNAKENIKFLFEIVGTVAVPIVLYMISENNNNLQKQKDLEAKRQEILRAYLSQVTTVTVDAADFRKRPDVQKALQAATLNVLRDSSLDRKRKGQIIYFLSEAELVQDSMSSADSIRKRYLEMMLRGQRKEYYRGASDSKEISKPDDKAKAVISLDKADLSYTEAEKIILYGTYISEANFRGANFREASFDESTLISSKFKHTNLRYASFLRSTLYFANFDSSDLEKANFKEVDLSSADFSDSNLRGARFDNANLGNPDDKYNKSFANFSGSNLEGADLSTARHIKIDRFDYAILCRTKFPPGTQINSDRDCEKAKQIRDQEQMCQYLWGFFRKLPCRNIDEFSAQQKLDSSR
jgi:uncharacterized protein YjbI with pentapeptide repeats